jgi:hypothetical protein
MYQPHRHWLKPRKAVCATRRTRERSFQLDLLEGRLLLSSDMIVPSTTLKGVPHVLNAVDARPLRIDSRTPIVTASANPSSLWPPNHKFVPVTVTGYVADVSGGVRRTVRFHVIDQYGQVQPSGIARVRRNGTYAFVVELQSSRLGQDKQVGST